jgi:ABC-2 type transport system ATP-binding protein
MQNSEITLELQNVSKTFTRRSGLFGRGPAVSTRALNSVSFRLHRGETLGLLGPNGSGKTTLLKAISTLIEPSEGTVLLDGIDVGRRPEAARRRLGLVTCDERSFYWRLSARENLRFFGALYGMDAARTNHRSEMLLNMLGLSYAADRPFQSYSSGMKQKLAIARGLLAEPSLILYDEPTRSLDPLSASHIRKWLLENRQVNPSQTHLIATNQLNEAEELCDRVLIINRGVLLAEGSVSEIRARWNAQSYARWEITYSGQVSREPLAAALRPAQPSFEPRQELTVVRFDAAHGDDRLSKVLTAVLAAGGKVLDCRAEEPSFDEIFCSMIENKANAAEVAG